MGNMGLPMAKRLLDAGNEMVVYDLDNNKGDSLVQKGATWASSPSDVAKQAAIIFSMVTNSEALEAIATGEKGIFESALRGATFIDMSTVSPRSSEKVANEALEKGITYLRIPVTGSTGNAEAGNLGIIASGDYESYEQVLDLLKILGQKIFYLGAEEESRYMKLALNIMVGITSQMMGEALAFGHKAGLDWKKMLEVMSNSSIASPLVCYKEDLLATRDFTPMFTVTLMEKDIDMALDVGKDLVVHMPVTGLVKQQYAAAKATGKGDLDFFALVTLAEEFSGIK